MSKKVIVLLFLFVDKPQAYTGRTFFENILLPQNSKAWLYLISDRYCHHRSNYCIIIPIDVGRGNKTGLF